MAQQTIANEGAFERTIKTQINENFTELYTGYDARVQVARQSATVTAASSTTLADLTGLVHTLEVGTYKFKVSLQALSTGNGGTKVAFNYTAPTSIQLEARVFTASAVAVTRFTTVTDQASVVAATVANISLELEGTIVVATAGTMQVQGTQNASHVDTTSYYLGSTFEVTKIA
jgi:hypothetical protein